MIAFSELILLFFHDNEASFFTNDKLGENENFHLHNTKYFICMKSLQIFNECKI